MKQKLKSLRTLLLTLLVLLPTLSGCRMNNGFIGDLFGTWYVASMTVDGEANPALDPDHIFWSFQNQLICITLTADHHDSVDHWGSWQQEGDMLYLDFTHHDDGMPGGLPPYVAPDVLMFPVNSVVALRMAEQGPRSMRLERSGDDGRHFVYELKKTW